MLRCIVKTLAVALLLAAAAPVLAVLALRWINPPLTSFMLQQHWRIQTSEDHVGPSIYYRWVDIDDIAPALALAVVASEDQTFPRHNGFVWKAINEQLTAPGGPRRGASSISQQVAKNLFLWPAKSYIRKAVEAYITVWMELLWPKRRILEMYLNIAQFDDRVFGAGAAAPQLFGVRPARLDRAQCALLAAALPAPQRFDAAAPGAYMQQRQRWILGQMRQLGDAYLAPVLAR